jgi:hypothetical protein
VAMLSPHLHVDLTSCLLSSGPPTKILFAFIFSLMRGTSPTKLILLELTVLKISGEKYKLLRYSLQNLFLVSCYFLSLNTLSVL